MSDVIPIVEEFLNVDKQVVETGASVRVTKRVDESTQTVHQTLVRDQYDVQRTPVELAVDSAPAVRYEDNAVVISVVEERLVTRKQLFVVEEVRLVRRSVSAEAEHTITLAREVAVVERRESPDDAWKRL
jgi:uncharacterized protein (TIGR02271 family)